MASELLSNSDFLESFLRGTLSNGLLPIDELLIKKRLAEYEAGFRELVKEKTVVAEQSGDNWHDGAFRATDAEADRLARLVGSLNHALAYPRVDYPHPDEQRVTLGTRALVESNVGGTVVKYSVEVVGFSRVYDRSGDDLEVASLESPIAKAIVGQLVGGTALMDRGDATAQPVEISIQAIDQVAISAFGAEVSQ